MASHKAFVTAKPGSTAPTERPRSIVESLAGQARAALAAPSACDYVRPAVTPPSTSWIAPVVQSAWSESRKAMWRAMSSGLPTRPMGCMPPNPLASVSSIWSGFMNAPNNGVTTTAGETAFTLMPCSASSTARVCVNECRPALAIEYAVEGVAFIACRAHIEPMVTIEPERFLAMFRATACVMKKSGRFRSKLVLRRVLEVGLWYEESCGVYEVFDRASFLLDPFDQPADGVSVVKVCGDGFDHATAGTFKLPLCNLEPSGIAATMTTEAPCSARRRAVASPMPLEPPTM
jgi:hypothetical protein